jgi:hypothetical protein
MKYRVLTDSELATVRTLAEQGKGVEQIRKRIRCSSNTMRRLLKLHGIELDAPVYGPKKRNPMNSLQEWRPPTANTDLERVVQELRKRFSPVCAEDTIRYPSRVPPGYTMRTLFRVGHHHNVPASELEAL